MFASDHSISSLRELFAEFKKYLELQKEYTTLEITEKLTLLLSTLILILLLIALGMVALFYLSFTFAYLLAPVVGSLMASFALIAGIAILMAVLLVVFHKQLIVNPMTRFLSELFLHKDSHKAA